MPRIEGTRTGLDPRGREVWSPVVIVKIMIPNVGQVQGPAVIDSGADMTVIPFEAVAPLGVSWANLPKGVLGQGAGGSFERRPLAASVHFREWLICDEVDVAEPGRLPVVLLGRVDFFQKFVVRFAWHKAPPELHVDPIVTTAKKRK